MAGMPVRTERARRLPPDERREALITAALPLVLWHGPGVTTRQIAEAADVAEGTIFRVFEHKEELIRAVTERAFDPAPTLAELAAVDRRLDLRTRLEAVVEILQRRLTGVFTLIDALGLHGPPPGHDHRRSMNDEFRAAIVDVIGEDRRRLRVPPVQLATVLRMFVFSATHPRISDGHPLTARQIVDFLLDGMLDHTAAEDHPC